jgi:exosortase
MEVIGKPLIKKNNHLINLLPIALLAMFVALFYPTFAGLFARWIKWDESLSHGLLVNSVFVYLLYKSLPWQANKSSTTTSLLLLCGLTLCSLAWFMVRAANIYVLEQLLLIILLCGLFANCYGLKTAFSYRLLLLLPIFTIPVWDQLTTPLVNLSGLIVGKMVQLVALPAVIEGNSIFIPFGQIVIADGCSGLRYFEIALALAYIIGLLNNYSERKLLPALLFAAVLGLLANWIRIFILVLIGYESKMESSLMANHEYFGWFVFGVMCLPAIYWAPVAHAEATAPQTIQQLSQQPKLLRIMIPLCLLAVGPALNFFISSTPKPGEFKKVLSHKLELISERKMPMSITAPDHSFKEVGLLEIQNLHVFAQVHQYQRTTSADKLVPYIAKLYNSEEWMIIESKNIHIAQHNAKLTNFRRKASDYKIVQLQWFQVGSYTATSITSAKLLQIPALLSDANNFKIVTLQSPCNNANCADASAALINNATDVFASSPAQ